jgi:hypothetical protein
MEEQPVLDEDGKDTGKVLQVPKIIIVNMGWKNFFGLLSGMAGRWGTVLDRDLRITRHGKGQNDTEYEISPGDPYDINFDGQVQRFDLRNEAMMKHFFPNLPNLQRIVAEKASKAYFEKFFLGTPGGATDGGDTSSAPAANAPAAPNGDAPKQDEAAMAAMRQRVMGHTTAASGGDQQPAAAGQVMRNF